jgi:hypothetical protein
VHLREPERWPNPDFDNILVQQVDELLIREGTYIDKLKASMAWGRRTED